MNSRTTQQCNMFPIFMQLAGQNNGKIASPVFLLARNCIMNMCKCDIRGDTNFKGSDSIITFVNFLFSDFKYDKMRIGIAPLMETLIKTKHYKEC